MRHIRTKLRHARTSGFVERLQGTILHERWRIAFRRRYVRRRHQLQSYLVGFLEFYDFQRPHQSYRTKGRTPAEILLEAIREHRCREAQSVNTIPELDSLELISDLN